MNQRQFGRKSESNLNEYEGQLTLFDVFNDLLVHNQSFFLLAKIQKDFYNEKELPVFS